jgi:hypothetical protein
VELAAGYDHNLALKSDGTLVSWGFTNQYGLGNVPAGVTSANRIACGGTHSLAALGDGSVILKPQPPNRTVQAGARAVFNALAVGGQPLRYQWYLNGLRLSDATNALLVVTNTQLADAGNYSVAVANSFSSATGFVAALTVRLPIPVALESSNAYWSVGGNPGWFGETVVTHDGADAAQSGPITHSQQSILQTMVLGPAGLSFWWKVSSEEWFDQLSLELDGVTQATLSGEIDWRNRVLYIPAGWHTLRWIYAKDGTTSVGADAAWLDQVIVDTNPPAITVHPSGNSWPAGTNVSLGVVASGLQPLTYQWLRNGTNLPGALSDTLLLSAVNRRHEGIYAVSVSNVFGATLSSNAVLQVLSPQRLGAATLGDTGGLTLISGDADGTPLTATDLAAFEAFASTNLTDWIPLTNGLSITNGTLLLRDSERSHYPARYYRLMEH